MRLANERTSGSSTIVNAAIGAVGGVIAVWVMDRVDWTLWRLEGPKVRRRTTAVRPGGEPPAHVIATKLERLAGVGFQGSAEVPSLLEQLDTKGLTGNRHHILGTGVHHAIGIGPATAYGIMQDKLPFSGAARGALYGLTLFLAQDEAANALTRLSAKPPRYPWQDHVRGLISHLVYGIVTDAVVTAAKKQLAHQRAGTSPAVTFQ